jgi:fucose permease
VPSLPLVGRQPSILAYFAFWIRKGILTGLFLAIVSLICRIPAAKMAMSYRIATGCFCKRCAFAMLVRSIQKF